MTENLTDVTTQQSKKKILEFVDDLSKYPPMTFERYRDADGNHTNWFPQIYHKTTASLYREWFTLAVLNNRRFIMLVYKRRDPDATKIFTENINSVFFRRFICPFPRCRDLILECVKFPFTDGDKIRINYSWNFDISWALNYYNDLFTQGNINSVSSNIKICNEISHFARKLNKIKKPGYYKKDLEKMKFIYDVVSKNLYKRTGLKYYNIPIIVFDIDNIYAFQVLSNSTCAFKYFKIFDFDEDRIDVLNSTEVVTTLLEIIIDVLK